MLSSSAISGVYFSVQKRAKPPELLFYANKIIKVNLAEIRNSIFFVVKTSIIYDLTAIMKIVRIELTSRL